MTRSYIYKKKMQMQQQTSSRHLTGSAYACKSPISLLRSASIVTILFADNKAYNNYNNKFF